MMLDAALEVLEPLVGPLTLGDEATGASGAAVHHVRMSDGTPAVLKLVARGERPDNAGHRREQAFYQHLADHVRVTTPAVLACAATPQVSALLLEAYEPTPPAAAWSDDEWISLAVDLAALHDSSPRRVSPLDEPLRLLPALGGPPGALRPR